MDLIYQTSIQVVIRVPVEFSEEQILNRHPLEKSTSFRKVILMKITKKLLLSAMACCVRGSKDPKENREKTILTKTTKNHAVK